MDSEVGHCAKKPKIELEGECLGLESDDVMTSCQNELPCDSEAGHCAKKPEIELEGECLGLESDDLMTFCQNELPRDSEGGNCAKKPKIELEGECLGLESDDVMTFCQNELPCIAYSAFEDMRKRGELCDLTIKVQNELFTAHRVIIAAGIPYFRSVFTHGEVETVEKEIAVDNLDPRALETLIHFAYRSKVDISAKNVKSLLVASRVLQLDQVSDACVEFLTKRMNVHNVLQIRALAHDLNNNKLFENSNCYILKTFEEFSKSKDFLSMSCSCVKDIISADDLNVTSEKVTFEAVVEWVEASPSERYDVLPELLEEVRMIYLPIDYLIEQVASAELVKSSKPCMELIDKVKNYHLLPKNRMPCLNLKVLPRKCGNTNETVQDLFAICCSKDHVVSIYNCDFANSKWCLLGNKVQNDSLCFVAATSEKIYLFLKRTIKTFHPKTGKWEVLGSTHEHTKEAAIVCQENFIYCFGGKGSETKVCCFDTQQNKWLAEEKMATERRNAAATILGDTIYLTGGGYCSDDWHKKFIGNKLVEKYHPPTSTWNAISDMLTKRAGHGCTSFNGKIYVCGGFNKPESSMNSAEVYDPLTDQWTFISSMKFPKPNCSVVSLKTKICALYQGSKGSKSEMYDPVEFEWKDHISVPANFFSAVAIPAAIA